MTRDEFEARKAKMTEKNKEMIRVRKEWLEATEIYFAEINEYIRTLQDAANLGQVIETASALLKGAK